MKQLRIVLLVVTLGLIANVASVTAKTEPSEHSNIGSSYTQVSHGYPIKYLEVTDYMSGSALSFKPHTSKEIVLSSFILNTTIWTLISSVAVSGFYLIRKRAA